MKKIFIRSPYFIEVNELSQIGSKVELYFYNSGTAIPTLPTYTLSKPIASALQPNTVYNISNYAKDFIKPIAPVFVNDVVAEDVTTWCYVLVKRYKEVSAGSYTLLDEETIVCLNGFSKYSDGYNYSTTNVVVPMFNTEHNNYITSDRQKYLNIYVEVSEPCEWNTPDALFSFTPSLPTVYKLPLNNSLSTGNVSQFFLASVEQFKAYAYTVCEPKYTPIICNFVNRYGGWEFLTFFKANMQSIEVNSKDFNMLPSAVNYNVLQGQKQVFNKQGKQKIKCNTGWVDENLSELIEDMLLSNVVLLDGKPAIVKSQSFDIKTSLNNKNINYEIEFEFNYGLINDVI